MIRAEGLTYQYPGGPVLQFPDIRCGPGDQLLVLGRSGSGKSTLLQLLSGLRRPQTGKVYIHGRDLSEVGPLDRDRFRGRHVGLVFQTPHFLEALTAEQNVALARQLTGQEVDRGAIRQLLERLGLGHRSKAFPRHCSQGEQQRLSLARALINQPDILLADEPTSALDDHHCHEVLNLLEAQAESAGSTLIVVTHDRRIRDRIPKTLNLNGHD